MLTIFVLSFLLTPLYSLYISALYLCICLVYVCMFTCLKTEFFFFFFKVKIKKIEGVVRAGLGGWVGGGGGGA